MCEVWDYSHGSPHILQTSRDKWQDQNRFLCLMSYCKPLKKTYVKNVVPKLLPILCSRWSNDFSTPEWKYECFSIPISFNSLQSELTLPVAADLRVPEYSCCSLGPSRLLLEGILYLMTYTANYWLLQCRKRERGKRQIKKILWLILKKHMQRYGYMFKLFILQGLHVPY